MRTDRWGLCLDPIVIVGEFCSHEEEIFPVGEEHSYSNVRLGAVMIRFRKSKNRHIVQRTNVYG